MFLIMALVSGDDVYGLSSAWRSSGVMPHSSRKHILHSVYLQAKKVVNPSVCVALL